MSAVALIPQDTAGLSAFNARKAPSGAQDDDPDADFNAALTQTADAAPASTSLSPATPAGAPLPNNGDEIWRRLAAFSDEATAPQAAVESNAPPAQARGDLPGAVTEDPKPALPASLSKAQPAERAGGQDARVPPKPDVTPVAGPAPATASDTALARPSRAASSNVTSSLPSASLAPERFSRAPDKTAAKAPSTSDRTTPKAETAAPTPCPSSPPSACGLATLTASPPPAQKAASPLASPSAEQDSVARIGAALAFPGDAQKPAASDPGLKQARYSEGEPQEGTATAIHVVAQQTWLQPVSPVFSPGLSRQAAADRAVLERPQAAGGKTEESDGANTADSADGKDAAAVETDSQLPPVSAPEKTPQTPFASVLSSGGANLAPGRGELSKPAAAAAAASTSDDTQRSLMAAPRRDLEITLAPKELGGLEVRMKSAGDRLELAFVADRGETARLISDKSAALTSQLHDAGIGLGGIDISSAASGPGGSGDAPPAGKQSADSHPAPQRQNSSGRDRQDRENETDDQTGDARPRGERGFYL